MKYFFKVDGDLVEASLEQIEDKTLTLYNEDNEIVREADLTEIEVEEEDTEVDKIASINDNINTLVANFQERFDAQEKEIKTLKENAQKAFPIEGDEGIKHTDNDNEVMKMLGKHWDRKRQGTTFDNYTRPLGLPEYKPEEKTVDELYKFFGLVSLASNPKAGTEAAKAMDMFNRVYGKTQVGDTGNVFPIPDIVESEIIWFARERSFILQYGRVIPMVSEKHSWPRETASATVSWGNTTSQSEPTVDEVELDAEELSCWAGVKNAHMADSRSDIVAWLTANLGEAAGLELDNKAFNGTGTDDPFICSGILTAHAGNSVTMDSGSTAFSNLSSTNLSNMIAALDGVRKTGARFMMHGSVLHYVRDLKDTNGRPIFMDGHIGAGVPGTIFGYPYSEVIKCPDTSGANTAFLGFGNPQYFFVGRRLDSATLDVDPYGLWTTNRTRYKIYQRWALVQGLPAAFVRLITASS